MATENVTLQALKGSARNCTACELYKQATQVVFSEGSPRATVMLVGEAPGNDEDLQGRPFVGPAGKLLRKLLDQAGFTDDEIYYTNAVKHFKWQAKGKRRLHVKPNYREVTACKPWLQQELEVVQPRIVVCLGATAAQSFFGRDFRVLSHRGELFTLGSCYLYTTLHPAAVLRMPTPEARQQAQDDLLADLLRVRELLMSERDRAGTSAPTPMHDPLHDKEKYHGNSSRNSEGSRVAAQSAHRA